MLLRTAVVIGLAALYDSVDGSALPFALDADGCVVDYQPGVDYYPPVRRAMMEGAGISHPTSTKADDFAITYHKTYKVVRNLRNSLSYILRHCGTPEELPDLPADAALSPVFVVPAKKWSSGLTTTYTFLEELDLISHAVVIDQTYMTSPCGKKLVACGVIAAPPTSPAANWSAAVVASGSEVHFTDGGWGTNKAALPIDVAFDASQDPGLLNRAEWLKFAAAFFNKEPEANHVFDEIRSRFEVIEEMVTAELQAGVASPRVAYLSSWGGPSISIAAYKQETVSKAGGTNVDASKWCPLSGSAYLCANTTMLKEVLKTVDVVIDESSTWGLDLTDPLAYTIDDFKANFDLNDGALTNAGETSADYPFLASNRVFRYDKRIPSAFGGSDWTESSLPHADIALMDFALVLVPQLKNGSFFHPGEGSVDMANRETRWLRNIAVGELPAIVDPAECDDTDKLQSSQFAVCPDEPAPPPVPLPLYNFCDDRNDFCITTSNRANIVTLAGMQATIAQLQAENAQIDELLAEKEQCAIDKSLNAAEVLQRLKVEKTIKVVFTN